MVDKSELREMFLTDVDELLSSIEAVLMGCEHESFASEEDVRELFRLIHTVKGSCSMMGYTSMSQLSHRLEDLMSFIRDNPVEREQSHHHALIEAVFSYVKYVRQQCGYIAEQADHQPPEDAALREKLTGIEKRLRGEKALGEASEAAAPSSPEAQEGPWRVREGYQVRVRFKDTPLLNVRTTILRKGMEKLCGVYETIPPNPQEGGLWTEHLLQKGLVLRFILKADKTLEAVESFLSRQAYVKDWTLLQSPQPEEKTAAKPAPAPSASKGAGSKTIAIRQDKLNVHSDLVGELATCCNMLSARILRDGETDEEMERLLQNMSSLIDLLHKSCLEMSMVPMEIVYFRMRLIMRDMSTNLGKQVKMICEGGGVSVDKSVAEHISDPLMHLVRNAMDHGIGTPEQRKKIGKPETGQLILRAQTRRDDLVLTIEDDGAGINREKVLDAAQRRGLLTKAREDYTPQEINDLVMMPGLSTKQEASAYSGRGVGLDVVQDTLRQLGGDLQVSSEMGKGSTFTITIPTTLSMTKALQVDVCSTVMIIPAANVRHILSEELLQNGTYRHATETSADGVWTYQGESYPVMDVGRRFGQPCKAHPHEGEYILVSSRRGDVIMRVDGVEDFRTVVVKPLPEYMKHMAGVDLLYAGCAILDDGRIGMVLDVSKL